MWLLCMFTPGRDAHGVCHPFCGTLQIFIASTNQAGKLLHAAHKKVCMYRCEKQVQKRVYNEHSMYWNAMDTRTACARLFGMCTSCRDRKSRYSGDVGVETACAQTRLAKQ